MRTARVAALVGALVFGVAATPQPATPPRPAATAAPAATTPYRAFFNWYDNASPGMQLDNVHVVNTSSAAVTGTVKLGAATQSFNLAPGAESWGSFPAGSIGGPAVVDATGPVLATQRVTYYRSFSEIPAVSATGGAQEGWWPWYDLASPGMIGDNIHVLNPAASGTANVTVSVAGQSKGISLASGEEKWLSFAAGIIGGPVHLVASAPVLASQRVETQTSFNELPMLTSADAGTTLYSNWYDLASPGFSADNLHLVNSSPNPANLSIVYNGSSSPLTMAPGTERHLSFPVGSIGGPIKITSDQRVVATQRVNYYDAFQEVAFHPTTAAVSDLWYTWYDDASPCFIGDNLHVTNPGPAAATGQVSLAGQPALSFSLQPGQETILNWPRGTIGGPVHLTATGNGVIVDQRVVICPPPPPPAPKPVRKIVVSLSSQHLWAYDNGNLVLETDVTTGRPELPTPAGTYHIFYRASPYQMISPWPYGSPYWYADAWVTWAMEFIQGGYFLHDAPWRGWYGPGSQYGDGTHGCVNIPAGAMQALWNWAQIGDEVDIVA